MSSVKTSPKKANSSIVRYTQIRGKLGGLLTQIFIGKGWIRRSHENDKTWYIIEKGQKNI